MVGLADNRQLDFALSPILLKLQVPMARNLREEARRQSVREGIARHEELLEALESNDPDLVVKALHEHGHLTYLGLNAGAVTRKKRSGILPGTQTVNNRQCGSGPRSPPRPLSGGDPRLARRRHRFTDQDGRPRR